MENPTCAAFEEYEEVPETVLLDFTEYDLMWVASKLYGAVGALVTKENELINWFFHFGCASVIKCAHITYDGRTKKIPSEDTLF